MALNSQRLRPTRSTLAAVGSFLWAITFGALRDFVWADLRQGLISLRGLSRPTRALVWLGFGLLLAMLGALLLNDLWRAQLPLFAMPLSSLDSAGRGLLLPVALLPLTLFLLAVAWSFILAGALHSHPLLRLFVLLIYSLTTIRQTLTLLVFTLSLFSFSLAGLLNLLLLGVALGALAAVPLFFLIRWRGRPRPVLEFTLLFVFVAASLAIANSQLAGELRAIGQPLGLLTLQYNLGSFAGWVLPLLLLIGLDMANFARQAAGWVTETITHRLPRWMPWLVLIPLLIWRLANVMAELNERVEASSPNAQAWEYAGAFVQVLLAVLLSWLILSLGRSRAAAPLTADGVASAAERHALPLIIVFNFLFLASALVADLGSAFPFPVIGDVVLKLIIFLSEANDPAWSLFVSVLALLAAFALAQRAHNAQPALAVYLGLFGGFQLWTKLTVPGRLLGAFYWRGPEPVDFWWVLLFSGVTLFWLARRQLTAARATRLIFLLLITALLRQTDFISSPFSPFLGFTGIGFIAFGLLWDTLTAGSWANADTRGLPRTSRILLYLGYALLTVTILNWAVTAHDLSTTGQFTGNVGTAALGGLGKPMLYAIFFITLAPPAHEAKTE